MQDQLSDILTLLDKTYLFCLGQFITGNIIVQLLFYLYILKIGINQDKYLCIVAKGETAPQYYVSNKQLEDIMDDPSAVDVTNQYRQAFLISSITYLLLDLYVYFTYRKIRQYQMDRSIERDYTQVAIFFYIFVILGIFQLIVCAMVRFSFTGKVCAGDYISTAHDN